MLLSSSYNISLNSSKTYYIYCSPSIILPLAFKPRILFSRLVDEIVQMMTKYERKISFMVRAINTKNVWLLQYEGKNILLLYLS